jgi:hypothetical protein
VMPVCMLLLRFGGFSSFSARVVNVIGTGE